jgi:hypothetical protein
MVRFQKINLEPLLSVIINVWECRSEGMSKLDPLLGYTKEKEVTLEEKISCGSPELWGRPKVVPSQSYRKSLCSWKTRQCLW